MVLFYLFLKIKFIVCLALESPHWSSSSIYFDGEIFTSMYSLFRDQVPVVQNLKKLLAYVTLKFLSWNMAKISMFENTLATIVNEFVINKLV